MLRCYEVSLKEALGKQQKVNLRRVGLRGEVLDVADGPVHLAQDLPRLARPDPHHATLYGHLARVVGSPGRWPRSGIASIPIVTVVRGIVNFAGIGIVLAAAASVTTGTGCCVEAGQAAHPLSQVDGTYDGGEEHRDAEDVEGELSHAPLTALIVTT
jgi:hypothetical protein